MSIETALKVAIEDDLNGLAGLEQGSEKHKAAVDSVTKLMDRAIEFDKLEATLQEQRTTRELENNLKLKQAREEKLDRIVKNCISVAGIVLPIGLTIWGTVTSLEFEKENTVTTPVGRLFINKLFPKK